MGGEGLSGPQPSDPPSAPHRAFSLTPGPDRCLAPLSLPGAVTVPELKDMLCPAGPFPAVGVGQHASSLLCQFLVEDLEVMVIGPQLGRG